MEKALQQHYIYPTSEIRKKFLLIPNEQIKWNFFLIFLSTNLKGREIFVFIFNSGGEYFKKKSIGVRGRLEGPWGGTHQSVAFIKRQAASSVV